MATNNGAAMESDPEVHLDMAMKNAGSVLFNTARIHCIVNWHSFLT